MTLLLRNDIDVEFHEFNGETDHARPLAHYPLKIALPRPANSPKGVSARHLSQEYRAHLSKYLWDGHLRPPSYFAASCDGAPWRFIAERIENQKRPD
ncbi:transposase [Actinoallomurus sp. NPDC050550]|uniref:transposase n=1 Tax=Actinoallomurus sp. NPDC050550 TaxID=3154937 RepID=UPI003409EDAA